MTSASGSGQVGPPISMLRVGGMSLEEDVKNECGVKSGLATIQIAVDLMNNNEYTKAIHLLKPKADVNMYHSMAYGSVLFLQAVFGMERELIDRTIEVLNKTVELCNRCRHPRGMIESLSSWVFGQRLDNYTASELQAEIFYAEANLILSFLTFLQDESLMSFVKGGLRIRSCHSLYKQLFQWVMTCELEGIAIEKNFAAGVRMGYGCFNLFLSLLPSRILRLLEFIGFSGNREVGLDVLEAGTNSGTFRAPLCTSFLLFYYTVAAVITGIQIDADHAQMLLDPQLSKYPHSVQFLYFKGRVLAMRGSLDDSMEAFKAAIDAQNEWKQIHHLCWWELAWCHCLKSEWREAANYSDALYRESKWSRATFLYMKASFTLMERSLPSDLKRDNGGEDLIAEQDLVDVMRNIAPLKQRIAGKSIPIEKFAVSKSVRYLTGGSLPLSGMELLYFHNAFLLIQNNPPLLQNLLHQVQDQLASLQEMEEPPVDDWCVVTFINGALLRVMGNYDEAEKCFLNVIENGDNLLHDMYTAPASCAELGLLYIKTGRIDEAEKMLEAARANYKGYHVESRIHFRIHEGQNKIKDQQRQ